MRSHDFLSPLPRWLVAVAIGSGASTAGGAAANAQVLVEGQPDAVHIEVRDTPLRQVLEALGAKYNLRYRSGDALDTPVTGTFDGPLPRVAARILDGYDFAMKLTPQAVDVLVLSQNQRGGQPVVVAKPVRSRPPAMTAQQANRYERSHFARPN
jgi:hypothetical protein